jgi:CheY-like chemotaxis protein
MDGTSVERVPNAPNLKVLVVDDNVDSVQLMTRLLDHYHCDMTLAFDGQDSIPLLANENFDLVVLDWQMPQMGGRDMLVMMDRLISENKVHKNKKVPVVIFTGRAEKDLDLPDCQSFRYTGFINKRQAYSEMVRSFSSIFKKL